MRLALLLVLAALAVLAAFNNAWGAFAILAFLGVALEADRRRCETNRRLHRIERALTRRRRT